MNETKRYLCLSLSQRKDALSNGAVFVRGNVFTGEKSHWEIPEESEDVRFCPEVLSEYSQEVVFEKQEKEKQLYEKWDVLLNEGCTLMIAKALKEIGIPEDVAQRIRMLKILGTYSKEQFYISWEYLIAYSESFNAIYGWEKFTEITESKNIGKKDYRIDIETNGLTEEEKAFVKYVLPIGERELC